MYEIQKRIVKSVQELKFRGVHSMPSKLMACEVSTGNDSKVVKWWAQLRVGLKTAHGKADLISTMKGM